MVKFYILPSPMKKAQEAREQNALLTIKDLVKLLKSSYSTIKRDLKYFREKDLFIPLRGMVKDIGPSSHKSKIVELNKQYYLRNEFVHPGQMRWLALKTGQKYSKSKN